MTRSKIFTISGLVLFANSAVFPGAASAAWSTYLYDGTHYGIQDGKNKLRLDLTEKQAASIARKMNMESGSDKASQGLVERDRSARPDLRLVSLGSVAFC